MLIQIKWQPKQLELWHRVDETLVTNIGYGGARGGAKSHGLRNCMIGRRLKYPGTNCLLFRKMYNDLLENHLMPLFQSYPYMRDWYNKTERILTFPNGSWTKFGYAEHHDDIFTFFGKAYSDVFIDEATDLEQDQIEFLGTCCRDTSGTGITPKMVSSFNPGRIGHAYIKRIFVDKRYDGNEDAKMYSFLQAFGWDNIEWVRDALRSDGIADDEFYRWSDEHRFNYFIERCDYGRRLNTLPENERKAHLLGDWDTFAGMFFADFTERTNVIDPFPVPQEWPLVCSVDPGYSSPCSAGLCTQDYNGTIYRVATYYERERSPQQHAEAIARWIRENKYTAGRWPDTFVAGRDAWAKQDRYAIIASDKTFADMFAAQEIYLQKATVDRHQGWWTVKSLLPKHFFVFKHFNKPFVDQTLNVIYDEQDKEDILGKGNNPAVEDHAIDDNRYNVMALYRPVKDNGEAGDWVDEWESGDTSKATAWKPGQG